jgi:hypothetical protein
MPKSAFGFTIGSSHVVACGRCGQERVSAHSPDATVCTFDACEKIVRAPRPAHLGGRAVVLDKGEDDQHRPKGRAA